MRTFGEILEHFTLSVDVVTKDNFKSIIQSIDKFTGATLAVKSVSVLISRPVFGEKKGEMLVREDGKLPLPLKNNGNYSDVRSLSYVNNVPL